MFHNDEPLSGVLLSPDNNEQGVKLYHYPLKRGTSERWEQGEVSGPLRVVYEAGDSDKRKFDVVAHVNQKDVEILDYIPKKQCEQLTVLGPDGKLSEEHWPPLGSRHLNK